MELRHLRYFVAVAEELNFRRACARLHVSQPPLSRQIQNLEDEVGVKLLKRSHRGVQLTEPGRLFLEEARQILSRSLRAAQLARAAQRGEAGRLIIAAPPMALDGLLLRSVRLFHQRFPLVELEIRELGTARQIESLVDKRIDLGYCGFQSPEAESELVFQQARHAAMCVALPPGHSLTKQRRIALSTLAGEPFISPPRRVKVYYDWYVSLCRSAGFDPRIVQEADTGQSMLGLVSAGLGVALVPETLRQYQYAEGTFRDLTPDTPRITFHIAWRRNDGSAALKKFLEIFREQMNDESETKS
jgi:DNA-binding transcriptional LysR family regulator